MTGKTDITPELLAQLDAAIVASGRIDAADLNRSGARNLGMIFKDCLTEAISDDAERCAGARGRGEVAVLKTPLLPPVNTETQEIVGNLLRAKLRTATTCAVLESATIKDLRAEVERLRALGLQATTVLQAVFEGEPWARRFEPKLSDLITEIERKP